jgi:hypothetical protein
LRRGTNPVYHHHIAEQGIERPAALLHARDAARPGARNGKPPVQSAAQSGVVLRNEELRAEPFLDAKVIAPIAKDARVEVLRQQGAWSLVTSAGKQGWMRSLNLRIGVAASGQASGLLALESGRSGGGNAIATLGIRGVSKPGADKAAALQALEAIAAGADAARAIVVDANKTEFSLAQEPVQLALQSAQAGRVYVLRADADGLSVEFVFPNRADGDNAIQAAQKLTLPHSGWTLAAGTPGRSYLLVLVSAQPVELKFGELDAGGGFDRLPMSAENARALQQAFRSAGYGAALVPISVSP